MDTDVQDTLLQKLNEYGDSFLGGKSDRRKKKKLKRKVSSDNAGTNDTTSDDVHSREETLEGTRKHQKKKRRKLTADNEASEDVSDDKQSVVNKTGQDKQIEQMKEQLGLKDFVRENSKGKPSDSKQKPVKNVDVVVFQSHKSKRKLKDLGASVSKGEGPEFDMKQARFDVRKLGIKGFQGTQKKEAVTAYLMQLGARPEKNTFINYKKFQRKKKIEMEEERRKKEVDRKLGYKVKKPERDRKRPTDKNDIGHLDGQVGKFKRGTLFVDKDMLKKMK